MQFNHTISAILRGRWMLDKQWALEHLPMVMLLLQGGNVNFVDLCPGSYFLAIGNDDNVSVTPIRQFISGKDYSSRLTIQRGSGNVSKQNRKNL